MVLATSLGFAETITKPHTFAGGTKALASQVNANFDTVYNRVNQLNRLVVKDDGVEIGTLVGLHGLGDPGSRIVFITSKGFISTIMFDRFTGNYNFGSRLLYSESSNCTGSLYYVDSFDKQVVGVSGGTAYYIPSGSVPSSITFNSYMSAYDGNCYVGGPDTIYAYELSPNVEAITGVPNSGYSGPFTIDIE
jgi:hypothetical protein